MKKVKTSLKGRKCRLLHCKQILSIYNHDEYCHVHLSQLDYGNRPKLAVASHK